MEHLDDVVDSSTSGASSEPCLRACHPSSILSAPSLKGFIAPATCYWLSCTNLLVLAGSFLLVDYADQNNFSPRRVSRMRTHANAGTRGPRKPTVCPLLYTPAALSRSSIAHRARPLISRVLPHARAETISSPLSSRGIVFFVNAVV